MVATCVNLRLTRRNVNSRLTTSYWRCYKQSRVVSGFRGFSGPAGKGDVAAGEWWRRRARTPARPAEPDTRRDRRRTGWSCPGSSGRAALRSPSRATMSRSACAEAATTARSARPLNLEPLARPPEPVRGRPEQFARRGRRHLLQPGRRVAPGPPEQARVGAADRVRHLGRRDVQQREAALRPAPGPGPRPRWPARSPRDPDIYRTDLGVCLGHVYQPPRMCSPAHSASTPRTSAAGTVSSPSLVNSPRSGADP